MLSAGRMCRATSCMNASVTPRLQEEEADEGLPVLLGEGGRPVLEEEGRPVLEEEGLFMRRTKPPPEGA